VNSSLLQLLSHDLLFAEPGVLWLTLLIHILAGGICRWSLWWLRILALGWSRLGIGCRHIKHDIIEVIINFRILFLSSIITGSSRFRWILELYVDYLVILQLHVLLNEVEDSLAETDLVVQTRWPYQG
jgi:hypothetical protein